MNNSHYDVIIIGTGAGGGTLARILASSGKKILVLERGAFLPQEKANWNSKEVVQKDRYRTSEVWYDKDGKPIHPYTHYLVGGNTKFYGAALFRFRERDFEEVIHKDGISPEWPLKYQDFAPYYDRAEELYDVHGKRGLDPTEPPSSKDYPFPPVSHEPYIEKINYAPEGNGFQPFYLPLGIKLNEANHFFSSCIRCNTCDGFPCLLNAKADVDTNGIRPAISYPYVTLKIEAKVIRLYTSASGRQVNGVEVEIAGERQMFSGEIVVVACGAINSAVLLLKSANDRHPNGLANSSALVGRNYMTHKLKVIAAVSVEPHSTAYTKTIGINDFYWGEKDFPYPMGNVRLTGTVDEDRASTYRPLFMPQIVAKALANRTLCWLITTEDLLNSNNRVRVKDENIFLDYTTNNEETFNRLIKRWSEVLRSINPFLVHVPIKLSLKDVGHQCGTCRFGEDPKTSVLDLNCRTHDVDNLYVVDSSFFPSSAALNPALTIVANALRVGEHLLERLK